MIRSYRIILNKTRKRFLSINIPRITFKIHFKQTKRIKYFVIIQLYQRKKNTHGNICI